MWPHNRQCGPLPKRSKPRITRTSQRVATDAARRTLFALPRELRDEIYKYFIPTSTTIAFAIPNWSNNATGRFFIVTIDMSPYSLAILGVCQQTRAEANALLYGTNHFHFSIGVSWPWRATPSAFNTIRALPQSGISQIKECTIRIDCPRDLRTTPGRKIITAWLAEVCQLFKQGGQLQVIKIELRYPYTTEMVTDVGQALLAPFKCLRGLKSVEVLGLNNFTKPYGAKLKTKMESEKTSVHVKRKAKMDKDGHVADPQEDTLEEIEENKEQLSRDDLYPLENSLHCAQFEHKASSNVFFAVSG